MSFYKGHALQLFLAPEHRNALIQFMAKHGLDKEFAGLKLLNKALYQEQLISREVYEVYDLRYSRKIVPPDHLESKMTLEQKTEKQRLEEKSRQFSMVLDQWQIHGPEWREKWVKIAEEWKDRVKNANLILELSVSSQEYKNHGDKK